MSYEELDINIQILVSMYNLAEKTLDNIHERVEKWNIENPTLFITNEIYELELLYRKLLNELPRSNNGKIKYKTYKESLPKVSDGRIDNVLIANKLNTRLFRIVRPDLFEIIRHDNPIENIINESITSKKKVNRICKDKCCIHKSTPIIKNFVFQSSNCKYCMKSGKKYVCKCQCVLTTHPELCKEIDMSKHTIKELEETSYGSHKLFNFRCTNTDIKCDCHRWTTTFNHRTGINKTNCPYCSNNKVCIHNSLKVLYPELMKEWNFEKNNEDPSTLSKHSNKIVWWKCPLNNCSYKASIDSRTVRLTQCKICTNTSSMEQIAHKILNKLNIRYSTNKKYEDCKNIKCLPFDIYLESDNKDTKYNSIIELDGIQHFIRNEFYHKTEEDFKFHEQKDIKKNKYCKDNNIDLLRISYSETSNIEDIIVQYLYYLNKKTERIEMFVGKEYKNENQKYKSIKNKQIMEDNKLNDTKEDTKFDSLINDKFKIFEDKQNKMEKEIGSLKLIIQSLTINKTVKIKTIDIYLEKLFKESENLETKDTMQYIKDFTDVNDKLINKLDRLSDKYSIKKDDIIDKWIAILEININKRCNKKQIDSYNTFKKTCNEHGFKLLIPLYFNNKHRYNLLCLNYHIKSITMKSITEDLSSDKEQKILCKDCKKKNSK